MNDLKRAAKRILRTPEFDAIIADYIESQSDTDKDDWYTTSQNAADHVLTLFKSHLEYLAK